MRPLILLALLSVLSAAEPLRVVCGNGVVLDLVRQVGGARVAAESLIDPSQGPHGYQPRPEDARRLSVAQVAVINGLGFEGWFEGLVHDVGFAGTTVVAAAGVTPLPVPGDHHAGHDHDHDHGIMDPHAYGDLANGVKYVEAIRAGLTAADPAGAEDFRAWAEACAGRLRALDQWTRRELARIPAARRVIVTDHDGLRYFAAAYGFTVHAANNALEASEPSAAGLAELVGLVRSTGVPAIFIEHGRSDRLVQTLAAETGAAVAPALWVDSVPPLDGAQGGYAVMFLHNVRVLTTSLAP